MPRPPADGFELASAGIVARSDFQTSLPVSARRAMIVVPTGTYMVLAMTMGVTVKPLAGTPRSYVQACFKVETFAGVICVSSEYFWLPGSLPTVGQSFAVCAATPAVSSRPSPTTIAMRVIVRPPMVNARTDTPPHTSLTLSSDLLAARVAHGFIPRAAVTVTGRRKGRRGQGARGAVRPRR